MGKPPRSATNSLRTYIYPKPQATLLKRGPRNGVKIPRSSNEVNLII